MQDADSETRNAPSRAERINQWIVVVAGVLGILATVFGIFGLNQQNAKDQATTNAEDIQRELDAANREIGNLRSGNNQLQRDLGCGKCRQ